jgi:hypothetical protein
MQEKQSFFISFYFLHGIKIVDRCNYLLNRHYKEIEDALKWGKKILQCTQWSGENIIRDSATLFFFKNKYCFEMK